MQEFLELVESDIMLQSCELGLESICQLLDFLLIKLPLEEFNFLISWEGPGSSASSLMGRIVTQPRFGLHNIQSLIDLVSLSIARHLALLV